MDKIHIEKGSEQETPIIPLYGRTLCAEYFYLQLHLKNVFPKAMAFTNVLILFAVLKGGFPPAAGQRVSFGLHQQTDKREHAPVVRRHADLGSKRGGN